MVTSDVPQDNMEENDVIEEIFEDEIAEEVPDDVELVEDDQDDFFGFDDAMDHASALPERDDAELVYKGHTGPVFCCDINPKVANIVITGGQDDRALVWDMKTGETVFECTGHKDSVVEASFSHDGVYAVTEDLNGLIQVWQVATKTLVWCESIDVEKVHCLWVKWHHGAHVLLATGSSGEGYLWKIPSGECKMLPGYGIPSGCGSFMPDGKRAVIGYDDGSLNTFDLKSGTSVGNISPGEMQTSLIMCISVHNDNNLVAVGGGDGKVTLIKTQPVKVISVFDVRNPVVRGEAELAIECVAFCHDPTLPLLAAGTGVGYLYIWDIAKQTERHRLNLNEGITKLMWDRHRTLLYSVHLGGTIKAHDGRSGVCQFELTGHSDDILDFTLSQDGSTVLSTSDDTMARVFTITNVDR